MTVRAAGLPHSVKYSHTDPDVDDASPGHFLYHHIITIWGTVNKSSDDSFLHATRFILNRSLISR